MSDQMSFTLKISDIHKAFSIKLLGICIALLALPLLGVPYFSSAFWWSSVSLAALVSVAYLIMINMVYLTVTSEGIAGPTRAIKDDSINWSEDVLIVPVKSSGFSGINIEKIHGGPSIEKATTIFVPNSIVKQKKFVDCVKQYAPDNHPLRLIVKP